MEWEGRKEERLRERAKMKGHGRLIPKPSSRYALFQAKTNRICMYATSRMSHASLSASVFRNRVSIIRPAAQKFRHELQSSTKTAHACATD